MGHGDISNTVVAGTVGAPPWIFAGLLMATVFMLGVCAGQLWFLNQRLRDVSTEVRILGVHVQDTNAIMIREGLIKPGDSVNGPTGARQ